MSGTRRTISERIIETVATASETDPLELPPLYEAIDPDALDSLVENMTNGSVSFVYAEHEITVEADQTIDVKTRMTDGSTPTVALSGD